MDLYGDGHKIVTDADHISGRNYLLNTSQALSAKVVDGVGFVLGQYQFSSSLDFNKKYIFRAILYSDKDGGRLYCGSYPNWSVYYYQDIKKGENIISFPLQAVQESDGIKFTIDNCSAQVSLKEATLSEGTIIKEWQPASEDYAMKSDLPTKTIIQYVDINTLTDEGSFFVESNNLDHFPAGYRNQWYFLNVTHAVGTNRIKQTIMPDNSDSMGWTMTRTGSYNTDTHITEWASWLISDFANGKLLKSK